MMKFWSVVSSSILCDLYIQSIVATVWQPIGPMLVPPKKSSWIPRVSLTPYDVFLLLSLSRKASVTEITPSDPSLSVSSQIQFGHSAPSPDPISQRHGSFFPHVIPCHQVERMQGISKQSACLWSNPIMADLVESKIQQSQSAVFWNPNSHRIKTYLCCPSCCNLVWEWKDLNSAAGPLWLSMCPMTAILGLLW